MEALETHQPSEHGRTFSPDEIEDADFRSVAIPANMLTLPELSSRGQLVEHLSRTIPLNEYGLPLYFLRTDLLDLNNALGRGMILQDEVDVAAQFLEYHDGYPTQQNGAPFWTQLPHEPFQQYILFQRFLDLAEREGIRLMDTLAREENIALSDVVETNKEFYWSSRCRAYDLFIVAAEAKRREARTRKTENSHYDIAGTLLQKVVQKFNDDPELIDKMDAKELMDAFETLVKIQRLSLGLTGQNASTTQRDLNNPGQTVEVILRQLTKNSGLTDNAGETLQNRLALLMNDEATAMQAQELIVRATGAGVRD